MMISLMDHYMSNMPTGDGSAPGFRNPPSA